MERLQIRRLVPSRKCGVRICFFYAKDNEASLFGFYLGQEDMDSVLVCFGANKNGYLNL